MKKDYHIHTLVSDGYLTPREIFTSAARQGISSISITDHDAIGAYRWYAGEIEEMKRETGIELIPGIELDSQYQGVEIHVLGYGISLSNQELNGYLDRIQQLRRQRVRQQIDLINGYFKTPLIREEEVLLPYRDTLMKPHLVHALLDRGLFGEYRQASRWISLHARPEILVPKPPAAGMIRLIRAAGGIPVLAHPGYYLAEHGLNLELLLGDLIPAGLGGMEVYYRYAGTSPHFPGLAEESAMIGRIRQLARSCSLLETRGSDAHRLDELEWSAYAPDGIRPV